MKTLLVILGPTGVGKTELSLQIAEQFGSCIISADSRQFYRDIPIGTAAPTPDQLARVKHYFVGTLGLEDYYSASQYEVDTLKLLSQLFEQQDVVVMSGGSMMYIDAVCNGIDDIPTVTDETRQLMRFRYEAEGLESLVSELRLLDPAYYYRVDRKNTARVLHALEICYQTGHTFTSFRTGKKKLRPFNIIKVGLNRPRPELFDRINHRVSAMMGEGLLDEVQRVLPFRNCNSLNTVGYKELFNYLDGEWELNFALDRMRKNTRVYAKKQLTWFKRDESVCWFHPEEHSICDRVHDIVAAYKNA